MIEYETASGDVVVVSDRDAHLLKEHRWHVSSSKGGYVVRNSERGRGSGRNKVFLHVEIMRPPPGLMVDHRNRNPLDNRRENLRLATRSQNRANAISSVGKSEFKGVTQLRSGRWQAQISYDGKRCYLGSFESEEDAALAYDDAAWMAWGEYARLNRPGSPPC